jgi:hypothetical protein
MKNTTVLQVKLGFFMIFPTTKSNCPFGCQSVAFVQHSTCTLADNR